MKLRAYRTTTQVRPCVEDERRAHSEKNAHCGNTLEKKRWNDAYRRDMTEVVLKGDNTTNTAAWRYMINNIYYTGDPG